MSNLGISVSFNDDSVHSCRTLKASGMTVFECDVDGRDDDTSTADEQPASMLSQRMLIC